MAKVLQFPHQNNAIPSDPFNEAMAAIENRFGVSFQDYLGVNGKRSADTQARMEQSLKEETGLNNHKS
ncbi:hypothetical protein [Paenibacillus sp. KS-LC4]|uniref:hypothetical protein n=1 Tax=Paenibacillus sp. KS-LC4 TaxID=2979727 RepID=UPI0030CF090D